MTRHPDDMTKHNLTSQAMEYIHIMTHIGICEVKDAEIEQLQAEKDEAYRQRNHLVAALAYLFPSGIRATNIDGWELDWHGCVYIDLPTGQISYHYHDSQAGLFADLPSYTKPWDGHDKDAVHMRLAALEHRI